VNGLQEVFLIQSGHKALEIFTVLNGVALRPHFSRDSDPVEPMGAPIRGVEVRLWLGFGI